MICGERNALAFHEGGVGRGGLHEISFRSFAPIRSYESVKALSVLRIGRPSGRARRGADPAPRPRRLYSARYKLYNSRSITRSSTEYESEDRCSPAGFCPFCASSPPSCSNASRRLCPRGREAASSPREVPPARSASFPSRRRTAISSVVSSSVRPMRHSRPVVLRSAPAR